MKSIETERLILRQWCKEDYLDMYDYASDDRVGPNAGWPVHKNIDDSKEIVDMFMTGDEEYAVVLKSENKVIGGIGLHYRKIDKNMKGNNAREIGYVLNPKYWGNEYIPEAVKALIKFGFEELNLDLVWCGHFDFNSKSRRVVEKCGFNFKFEKVRKLPLLNDKEVNELYYNISREEYFQK
ncbi:GNAT family N-acetyltransferase [Clostridioides difficile]